MSMSIEAQFDETESHDGWHKLFQVLKAKSEKLAFDFSTSESVKNDNKLRNRFRDILPYNHARVPLTPCQKQSSDYINASSVKVPVARRSYICAQGPLPATVNHFWEMCWAYKSPAIVMLNSLIEKSMPTCAMYWPKEIGSQLILDDSDLCHEFCIVLVKEHITPVFVTRELRVSRKRKDGQEMEERTVLHFHFTHWPDFGVPQCPDEFLDFLWAVRQSGCFDVQLGKEECDPTVVHCTAGVGRTGAFVLVDVCLTLLSLYRMVDITAQLLELRTMRMGFVQTAEQLRFCFQAIIKGKKRLHVETPSPSPAMKRRPGELQLKTPDSSLSPTNSLPISPKSPRRELFRQDGRTPSSDARELLQNGKRQRTDGGAAGNEDEAQSSDLPQVPCSASLENGVLNHTPPYITERPTETLSRHTDLSEQQKRDADIRQKRLEKNEKLREKVEAIKRRQSESAARSEYSWKPWIYSLTAVGVGALAIWFTYFKDV